MTIGLKTFAGLLLVAALVQSIGSVSTFQETGLINGLITIAVSLLSAIGVVGMFMAKKWAILAFALATIAGIALIASSGESTPTTLGVLGAQIVFLVSLWRTRSQLT